VVTPLDRDRPSYRCLIAWGLITSLLVAGLYLYPPFFLAHLDWRAYDVLLRSAHRSQTSGRIVIVSLDERSLARFGRWPWPRSRLAQLVEKIGALGAASVGIDMIFAEPDETPESVAEQPSRTLAKEPRAGPGALTPNDAALAAVLGRGAFVLGYQMRFGAEREEGRSCVLHPIPAVTLQEPGARAQPALFESTATLCSLPGLGKVASGSGFSNVTIDADGIVRRMPLIIAREGLVYPSLGLATLIPALGLRQFVLRTTGSGTLSLALEDIVVPLDPTGGVLLHFRGEKRTFPYISAADVLEDRVAEGEFRDRIVFLGTFAPGLGDSVATPLDTTFPAVEVHATIADTILRRDFIRRPPGAPVIELALVLAAGPVAAFMATVAGVTLGGFLLVAVAGASWIATGWLMSSTGFFISPVFPGVALAFSFAAIMLASFFRERGRADRTTQHLRQTRETMLEELRKSEAKLRAAQERAKLGSWELDLTTKTASWSAEMFRLFDCDPARGAPTLTEFLAMVHPDDRQVIEEGLTRAVQTGDPFTQEFRNDPLRSPLRHFNAVVHATKNGEGRVVQLGGTIQDITALIEAKRALQISEQEAILGRVAASVAHEINNPLMAIKTRLHTLKKTVADRPELTEKLDLVMGQVDRIGRATRSMLGFFKQRTAYSKLVSYAEVIRAAIDLFDPSFEAKGVRVVMNLPDRLPGVSVSVDELQEVLINLLENERDALGRGNDLYVSAQTRDHQIVVRIEDSGPGLGPDPEKLFDAFYTTKSTGTGLGLTIARRICESYGGALTAENRKEGGACFEILLPLASKQEER
jgi:CHASE2 domain-containing sensor protein/nitrogen-specific signal transduction histidine kinase